MSSSALSRLDAEDKDVEEPLLGDDINLSAVSSRARSRRLRRVAVIAGGIAGVLILVLIVIKSQMHRIATNAIASTAMTIERMELTSPRADGLSLSVYMAIDSPSIFTAEIAPSDFTIAYHGDVVGVFRAPAMAVSHGQNIQIFRDTALRIENHTAWDVFARDLMLSDKLAYEIHGDISISVRLLGGLISLSTSGVSLQKNMTSDGMGGLKRMEIVDLVMNQSTETQVIASIKTCLYNPSTVTIHPVGQICMEAHYPSPGAASHVGHLLTAGLTNIDVARDDPSHPYCASLSSKENDMHKGYNLLELHGEMLGTNPAAISGLISKYLSKTPAAMTVLPCTPRATSVDIFNNAMKGLQIPAVLPPREEPLVGRMFFKGITLDAPVRGSENEGIGLSTDVTVEASSPLGPHSPLILKSITMDVGMYSMTAQFPHELIGSLKTRRVDITDGRLVEVSNITVQCLAHVAFEAEGQPFGEFVHASVVQSTVSLRLAGSLTVVAHGALGELTLVGLPLDVTSTLVGMNNFQRVSIDAFSLPGEAAVPGGEVVHTKVALWNPSLFAVSIGRVGLAMALADSDDQLGQLAGSMDLKPGANHLSLDGRIEPPLDPRGSVSAGVARFFSSYLRGEASLVQVRVTSVQYPTCRWLSHALIGLTIRTSFPGVTRGFQLITGLQMKQLDVAMEVGTATGPSNTVMRVRTDLTATLKMPASIAIPLHIPNVSVALTLQDAMRREIGSLVSERDVCEYEQERDGYFRLNMTRSYPVQFPNAAAVAAMAAFVTDLLTKPGNVTMQLSAAQPNEGAAPDVDTRMGMLPLTRIPISGAPQLPGMNSFKDPPVKILAIDILSGTAQAMTMQMAFEMVNPSVVTTALGRLSLAVGALGAHMGEAVVDKFELACCGAKTVLKGTFTFHPEAEDRVAATQFLSNFVSGYFTNGSQQQVTISGSAASTPLDVLQPALSVLRIPTQLPTLAELFPATPTLVTSSMLYTPSLLHLSKIPTALKMRNPFSESITVTGVDLLLYPCEKQRSVNDSLVCDAYYSDPLARFAPKTFEPIFVPANADGCYACCQGAHCEAKLPMCPRASVGQCMAAEVAGLISAEAIAALFHTATTGLLMKVNGTISASIGAYATELFYRQEALIVTMAK